MKNIGAILVIDGGKVLLVGLMLYRGPEDYLSSHLIPFAVDIGDMLFGFHKLDFKGAG